MQTSEEVQSLFDNLRPASFRETREQVGYERVAGQGEIQPQGWVINKDATVIIDESGLIVEDGALTLRDYTGQSVLDASGFRGAWVDYMRFGAYNASFSDPVADTTPGTTTTEVGAGLGTANYLASLSEISHWVKAVHLVSGTGSFTHYRYTENGVTYIRLFSAGGLSGLGGQFKVYQDIPIASAQEFGIVVEGRTASVTGSNLEITVRSMTEDHQEIAGTIDTIGVSAISGSGPFTARSVFNRTAHPQAKFIRLEIRVSSLTMASGGTFDIDRVRVVPQTIITENQGYTAYGKWTFPDIRLPSYGTTVSRSTTQTINNSTVTAITFTTEDHDSMAGFTASSTDVTVKRNGRYFAVGKAQFDQATAGTRRILMIYVNGVNVAEHTYEKAAELYDIHMNISDILVLNVNDVVTLRVHQNTGGTLNIDSASLKLYYMGEQ